jgi:hypothetical protein
MEVAIMKATAVITALLLIALLSGCDKISEKSGTENPQNTPAAAPTLTPDFYAPTEEKIIGYWRAAPDYAQARIYPGIAFFADRTYIEYISDLRTICVYGEWEFGGGELRMRPAAIKYVEGGELSYGYYGGELANGSVEIRRYAPEFYETYGILLESGDYESDYGVLRYEYKMVLGYFYRILWKDDPEKYSPSGGFFNSFGDGIDSETTKLEFEQALAENSHEAALTEFPAHGDFDFVYLDADGSGKRVLQNAEAGYQLTVPEDWLYGGNYGVTTKIYTAYGADTPINAATFSFTDDISGTETELFTIYDQRVVDSEGPLWAPPDGYPVELGEIDGVKYYWRPAFSQFSWLEELSVNPDENWKYVYEMNFDEDMDAGNKIHWIELSYERFQEIQTQIQSVIDTFEPIQ